MATFLDDISIYNAKAAVAIKNLSIVGRSEEATLLSSLKTTANDTTLTDELRLSALTALINKAGLLDVALGPYFPSAIGFQPTQVYAGIHNVLDGLNTGDFWHLTFAEYTKLVNLPSSLSVDFIDITGEPSDNVNLNAAFLQKEDVITASTANKFFSWDKTFKDVDYAYITNKPTTLSGFGISAADTLFDAKYVSQSSLMTSFVVGADTPITNSNSLVGALGNLQAQINSISASKGTLNTVGITTPNGFFINVSNSPIIGSGGDMALSLASQSGNTFFAAPSGGNGTPYFRQIEAADFPVVPGLSLGTYGNATQYPVISVDTKGRITGITLQSATGTGTVQSIDVVLPINEFGKTGGPITQNGTISFAWQNQTQKRVFAAPSNNNGVPGFRLLEKTDIPNIDISQVNNLTAALNNNNNLNNLPLGQIWIGNSSEQPTQQTISGVISLGSDGSTTVNPYTIGLDGLEFINTNTILGRYDSPAGEVQTISLSGDFVVSNTGVLSLQNPVMPVVTSAGQLLTYNSTAAPPAQAALPAPTAGQVLLGYPGRPAPNGYGLIWQTLGGVISGIDHITGAVSLSDNSIDYTKLKNSTGNNILLGRAGGAGAIVELNGTQAATIIDAFNGGPKGLVPAIASPDATKFLAGDGTWITPTGGGSPAGTGSEVQYRLSSTTFGAIPYMSFDSPSGEVRAVGPNFLLVDDVTTVAKSVSFDLGLVNSTGLSWAFPDTTDTFVGEVYAQTLENKTLGTGTAINVGSPAIGTMWYDVDGAGTLARIDPTGGSGKYLSLDGSYVPYWTGVTASTATNLSGGNANEIPYQTGAGATSFITAPTTLDTYLKWTSSGYTWATAGSGSGTVNSGVLNALAYYSTNPSGTTVDDIAPPTSNGQYFLRSNVTGGVSVLPDWATAQTAMNALAGATTSGQYLRGNGSNVVMSAIQAGDVPTLNQNTTGTAANITATSNSTLTTLSSLSLPGSQVSGNISGNAANVTGTVAVANGGTGQTTYTNGQLLIGNTTGNTLTKATLTQGSGITITNGAGSITIASAAASPTLNLIQAATATNTINNTNFAQEWQWNTLAGGNGFYLSSTSTAAASNTQTLFRVALSGANATATQSTYAGIISNTHTGTSSTNYALQLTASGGTAINYALDVAAGISRFAAGTAASPQLILTPSSAAGGTSFSGSVNGSLWYDTNTTGTANSSLTLYKDTGYTKIITKDRNPDLATGSASGVLLADTSGTITKSADLIALGIFSGTADGTTLAASGNADLLPTSVAGSKTLPANFFGVGKTIEIFVSGKITTLSSPGNLVIKLQLGATPTDIATITLNLHASMTNAYWDARFTVVCRTTGATGNISANGIARMETNTNANMVFADAIVPTTLPTINTANSQDIKVNGAITVSNSVTVQNCYAIYLN